MKRIYIITLLVLAQFIVIAQSGPAGVGSSTSNILWLRSNDIGQANNTNISSWGDNSGNSNSISQPNSNFQPLNITNVINGYPAVRFSTDDRLRKTNFADFPTSAITVFMVNSTLDASDGAFSYASSSSNNDFLIYNSANYAIHRGINNVSGISGNDGSFHIVNVSWQGSDGAVSLWKDGTSSYTGTLASGTSITNGGCLAIAGEQDAIDGGYANNQFHNGDFAEIIVYNTKLNDAQKIIVANYLAAKYMLTISNDFYSYQSTHGYDLAGIGRNDASNIHTAAMSAGILQIENPSNMTTDGEYLLFGHDNTSISSWTTTEAPSVGNIQRIAREWRIDETGTVGTVDFKVLNSDLPTLNSGFTKYGIMVDSDGDFSNGATVYELSLSGSDYVVSGIDINDGDYISIAAIKPTIEFSETSLNAEESIDASIEVSLNYISLSVVSVNYISANGTATSGSDYTAVSSTLNIAVGTSTNNISVAIIDDGTMESDETFTVTISSPSSGINLGSNTILTYSIIDNDNTRKVSFNSSSSNGSEGTTSVNIGLSINIADGSNAVTVNYSVSGGTATGGGTDYTLSSGTVTFAAGATTANIDLSIINDILDEDNETIIITLSSPVNCNLGTPKSHTYTINDNDAIPTIQFLASSSSGSETVSSKVIIISLSAVSSKAVSVNLSTSGTAVKGTDYTISTNSVTIAAGNSSANVTLSISNDSYVEPIETVIITMVSPVNATIGTNNIHTYSINDDDTYGFDGPGGVGKVANIKLWVKAEDLPGSSNGDKISAWADKSGNGNNLSQGNSLYQPEYYSNMVNSFPMASFNQPLNRLIHNGYSDFPTDEISTIFVNKNTGQSTDGLLSYATSGSNNEYLIFNSNSLAIYRGNTNTGTGVNISDNTWKITQNTWQNSSDNSLLYTNGVLRATRTLSGGAIIQGGCLAIGCDQDAVDGGYVANQTHNGDFTEIIIYNFVLPSAHRNIVNSYLSAKYNISVGNDKYAGDEVSNGNYDFEVIGIGSETDGAHIEAHGSGGLWITQSANFGNGDYLLIGHNSFYNSTYSSIDDPKLESIGIEERWKRDWYFDKTDAGDVQEVDLTFDFVEAGMSTVNAPEGSVSNYKLLYRSTATGNWAIIGTASEINSEQVKFNDIILSNGDGYFAIGTLDAANSSLPVELMSFTASKMNETVLIDWATASEINNDYFEIERSQDLNNWKSIGKVQGNGNSNILIDYTITDLIPLSGISYYRLMQVDYDGTQTYTNTVAVNFDDANSINIYPNPTTGIINIEGANNFQIMVYTPSAELLFNTKIGNSDLYKLDLSKYSKGIYIIHLISDNKTEVKRVIVQ